MNALFNRKIFSSFFFSLFKLSKTKTENKILENQVEIEKNKTIDNFLSSLPPGQRASVEVMMLNANRHPNGRRYPKSWIYECILLKIRGAQSYRFLQEHDLLLLPHKDTMNGYLKKIGSTFGFSKEIFRGMQVKSEKMTAPERRGIIEISNVLFSNEETSI